MQITKLPKYVMVQVGRFQYAVESTVKLYYDIEIPNVLKIDQLCDNEYQSARNTSEKGKMSVFQTIK